MQAESSQPQWMASAVSRLLALNERPIEACQLRFVYSKGTNTCIPMKMVGNYAAKRASDGASAPPRAKTVSDFMTKKLITFHPDDSLEDVMNKLLKHKISGAPVVNESNELVGVISEGDCLKVITKSKYHNTPQRAQRVGDYMAKEVVTTTPDRDIMLVAEDFLSKRIRRFPVLDGGRLVGQISQKDVMKAVLEMESQTW